MKSLVYISIIIFESKNEARKPTKSIVFVGG